MRKEGFAGGVEASQNGLNAKGGAGLADVTPNGTRTETNTPLNLKS
jgi:hypothetical protein